MGLRQVIVSGTVGAVLFAGLTGLSTLRDSNALVCSSKPSRVTTTGSDDEHGMGRGGMGHGGIGHRGTGHPGHGRAGKVVIGPTCNNVEMVQPHNSRYVPDIAAASAADRAEAQDLLDGVNRFCRAHSAATLMSTWRPGLSNSAEPTHFFNPDPSRGLDPANPRAALVYDGRLGGVMFTGGPLPALGSIPRAHVHDVSSPVEMVHVYCTTSLKEAFTPNRLLGVKADLVALRLKIRPAIMDLSDAQLRGVLAKVREYAGNELPAMTPARPPATGGPDPIRQAMRTEVRRSLMVLTEDQLRRVCP